jgi:hypothetical protein
MSLIEFLFGRQLLRTINHNTQKIMANQTELVNKVNTITAQLQKIGNESAQTLQKVIELQAVIDAGPGVSPELQTAVDALAAQVQVVDDLVPDAVP